MMIPDDAKDEMMALFKGIEIPGPITVPELAAYLGQGLMVITEDQRKPHELAGILDETVTTKSWLQCEFDLASVKPVVRPWAHLSQICVINNERVIPLFKLFWNLCSCGVNHRVDSNGLDSWVECYVGGVSGQKVARVAHHADPNPYWITKQLIAWGFDVFNWLGRVGLDGDPVAIEFKEEEI